jgi:hypothetical protein
MFFRDMFCKKGLSKNDKFYAITIHPEDMKGHVPELEKKFIDFYSEEKPRRFFQHVTYDKKQTGGDPIKDNGDLLNPNTLKNFYGGANSTVKDKVDFITADGGFEWVNENIDDLTVKPKKIIKPRTGTTRIDYSQTSSLRVGDKIQLSSFGNDLNDRKEFNFWNYNIPTTHKIKSIINNVNFCRIYF